MIGLTDLPKSVQEELRKLSRETITDIATDVHIANEHAKEAAYPSDPNEAVPYVRECFRRKVKIEIEDPVLFTLDVLTMLRGMCSSAIEGNFSIDEVDVQAMCRQIDDAWTVLSQHEQHLTEVRARLRQIQNPITDAEK